MPMERCEPVISSPSDRDAGRHNASIRPPMMLKSVDLPQPEGPINATNSPCAHLEARCCRARAPSRCPSRTASTGEATSSRCASTASLRLARPCRSVTGLSAGFAGRAGRARPRCRCHSRARRAHRPPRPSRHRPPRSPSGSPSGRSASRVTGPKPARAWAAGDRREIDLRVVDLLADPFVGSTGRLRSLRHALLMHLVVVERAVVGDDDQQRNAVMHRGPESRCAHHEIAVAQHRHRQPPAAPSASAAPTDVPGPEPTPPPPSLPRKSSG